MTTHVRDDDPPHESSDQRLPHRGRLPGFVPDDSAVGLGDLVAGVASYVGLKPCGGCKRRAAALNRWVVFTRRSR